MYGNRTEIRFNWFIIIKKVAFISLQLFVNWATWFFFLLVFDTISRLCLGTEEFPNESNVDHFLLRCGFNLPSQWLNLWFYLPLMDILSNWKKDDAPKSCREILLLTLWLMLRTDGKLRRNLRPPHLRHHQVRLQLKRNICTLFTHYLVVKQKQGEMLAWEMERGKSCAGKWEIDFVLFLILFYVGLWAQTSLQADYGMLDICRDET